MATISQTASVPRKVKTVGFTYAARSPVQDLQFLSRFDVVVTGGILTNDQRQMLRSRRARLVLYQWSSARYPGELVGSEREWDETLKRNEAEWLLSVDPLQGGAATPGKSALWYDFGNSNFISAHAEHMAHVVRNSGYEGVFLDTLGFESLPEPARQEFAKRHPQSEYDRCQSDFLNKLRQALGPQKIIFTNQGYRHPELFLPHADFDLVENSFTVVHSDGRTELRPWAERGHEWEGIEVPMTKLVQPAAHLFPKIQFVHLNYVTGTSEHITRAIRYSFACAKLWNHISFCARPGIQQTIRDNIYFTLLGEPLTPSYQEDKAAGVAWRRFKKAIVAINSSESPFRIRALNLTLNDPPKGYVFPTGHKSSK